MKNNVKFVQGNKACILGALDAGYTFFAGYPITPSTELAELSAVELPKIGGKFIQMEDEIAGIAAAIGASLTGKKSMTATSGPGFSLKQENIGYAMMAEIPLVIVNVQRGGPSTGLPTSPAQGDMMQAKWGTHGDHPVIALTPESVQETYYMTIRAFNLAEKYRTPVMLMTDEVVGHMREKIVIPNKEDIEIINRIKPTERENYLPYGVDEGETVPKMASFGDGYRYHVTGLAHDETGFPSNSNENAAKLIKRLMDKVNNNLDDILDYEEYMLEDAEHMILSYGATARSARAAVKQLRAEGIKAGLFRLKTVWPFPEERVLELSKNVKNVLVAEMNLGQMVLETERVIKNNAQILFCGRADGEFITPEEISDTLKEVL
ncbi:MAG: 2-oxoacid:acceptor oxidoreductase subunit alpha [Bacillota bacterium]|nr:2-oxoacid:acceptor oxidoreductase subunit alpha [Bacillota bacterium]